MFCIGWGGGGGVVGLFDILLTPLLEAVTDASLGVGAGGVKTKAAPPAPIFDPLTAVQTCGTLAVELETLLFKGGNAPSGGFQTDYPGAFGYVQGGSAAQRPKGLTFDRCFNPRRLWGLKLLRAPATSIKGDVP